MCAFARILFYYVLHRVPRGVGRGGRDRADGVRDDHGPAVHDDEDDEDDDVSLSVGDQPLADGTLRGVLCTPHTARQDKQ